MRCVVRSRSHCLAMTGIVNSGNYLRSVVALNSRARRDYLKQPNGCFNPADFAATPLRIKMLAHFVEQ